MLICYPFASKENCMKHECILTPWRTYTALSCCSSSFFFVTCTGCLTVYFWNDYRVLYSHAISLYEPECLFTLFVGFCLSHCKCCFFQKSSCSRGAGQWKRKWEDSRPTWVARKWSHSCAETWVECAEKHCHSCRAAFAGLYSCGDRSSYQGFSHSCETSNSCTAFSSWRGHWLHGNSARPTTCCDILNQPRMCTSFLTQYKVHQHGHFSYCCICICPKNRKKKEEKNS